MKIDEAISRLEIFIKDASEVAPELLDDAIRLGIEALKVIKLNRPDGYIYSGHLLPGETEE